MMFDTGKKAVSEAKVKDKVKIDCPYSQGATADFAGMDMFNEGADYVCYCETNGVPRSCFVTVEVDAEKKRLANEV